MLIRKVLAASTAAVLTLGMAIAGASPAFAEHNGPSPEPLPTAPGLTVVDDNGLTCGQDGFSKPTAMNSATGSYSDVWGDVVWEENGDFSWDITDGYVVLLCIKGSTLRATIDTSVFDGDSFNFKAETGHGISHTGFMIISTPPAPVTIAPSASVTQYRCEGLETVAGFISVDLTQSGVLYTVTDSAQTPIALVNGRTAALPAGDYTVSGTDADGADGFSVTPYSQLFSVLPFTDDCLELPDLANWSASVSTAGEDCVQSQVVDGAITVEFSEGPLENPIPVRYYVDFGGADQMELTEESTPFPAGDYIVTAVATMAGDSINDSGSMQAFPVTVEEFEGICLELPDLANWSASAVGTNQVCTPSGVQSGSISVQLSTGSQENPNPVRYYIAYGTPQQQELTAAVTPVAPGSYTVTASTTDPTDSINNAGSTAAFAVTVGAAADQECDDLPTLALDDSPELRTLAFTGTSDLTSSLGLLAVLLTVVGMGVIARRRRVEV